jgi:methylenetetrahydrofolate dehydrogenase (NADP+)/methenyltetrahydrofolate cyclohydrolase
MTPTARILDGKRVAAALRAEVASRAAELRPAAGRPPGLAVILAGDDPASAAYVRNKTRACQETGIASRQITLPAGVPQTDLLAAVAALNADPAVDGLLIQLPLPPHLDERAVLEAVDPGKDVDGFTFENIGRLVENRPRFVPCTPAGILELLDREGIELAAALLLLHRHATVTVCHSRTADLAAETRRADILVAAAGRPGLITGDMVKPGAAVIDVGINRMEGKLVGDVDFPSVSRVASALTPVPGGVGPMTVAMLLKNTVQAFERFLFQTPRRFGPIEGQGE